MEPITTLAGQNGNSGGKLRVWRALGVLWIVFVTG